MNNKCPKCGSVLSLNVITNTWDCPKCGYQVEDVMGQLIKQEEAAQKEEEKENSNIELGKYNLYHCEKCNMSFIGEDCDTCFECGGTLEKSSTTIDYSKFIDFKLSLGDALNKYHKKILFRLLCPLRFRRKKTLKRLKGVYIPMYMFDSKIDGDVVFNASDVNVLDSSKKDKKMNYFKVVCNGHFDYDQVLINGSSRYNNNVMEKIDDYDYSELKDISELNLRDNVIYKEDCDNYNVFERLKNRCVNNSVKLMSELVKHSKNKVVDNQLDFNYDEKGIVLVPIYILVNEYKKNKYYFIMNGQNGNTYIKTPIGVVETIVFSLLLFTILFVGMLLFAIFV